MRTARNEPNLRIAALRVGRLLGSPLISSETLPWLGRLLGANAAAHALRAIERHAVAGDMDHCASSLATFRAEFDRLRTEAGAL